MKEFCRQLVIESPSTIKRNCVFYKYVPIEETPSQGARIEIVCAGACLTCHNRTNVDDQSTTKYTNITNINCQMESKSVWEISSIYDSIREGTLFHGFEVAGVIESFGYDINDENNNSLHLGQRVIVYPFKGVPAGYADLVTVPNLKYIIPIPDKLPISIAAMLPTRALLAMSAVFEAQNILLEMLQKRGTLNNKHNQTKFKDGDKKCKILIVGTGSLALWTIRIAKYYFTYNGINNYVDMIVASLRDEGFCLVNSLKDIRVVQWNECLYEPQFIERTTNICGGPVDIVIQFGTTPRSLIRSLNCLSQDGVILINTNLTAEWITKLLPFYINGQQRIIPFLLGTVEQLRKLVELVAEQKIELPPHSVFPCDQAIEVVQKLSDCKIPGNVIIRFRDVN